MSLSHSISIYRAHHIPCIHAIRCIGLFLLKTVKVFKNRKSLEDEVAEPLSQLFRVRSSPLRLGRDNDKPVNVIVQAVLGLDLALDRTITTPTKISTKQTRDARAMPGMMIAYSRAGK